MDFSLSLNVNRKKAFVMYKENEQFDCSYNKTMYINPIVFGDFADPSILKDGNDYYLVQSVCGEHYRLMPLWHSTDLIHWQLLYHVFDGCYHPDKQRDMLVAWAPDLVKVNGEYYIYNYSPDFGTWVTTCKDIKSGNWSKPKEIVGVDGIDPGHVIDDDGNRYLCMSKNLLYPLSADGFSITGSAQKICDDWPIPDHIDIEGMCTESPKFFKKGNYYYFLTAQGGTMGPPTSHCVVAYRAKHPTGPYEISPYNPIVHTDNKSHGWWSTGHGSLVDAPDGTTYILYHGIRNAHRYLGRQTLMMSVTWTDDNWFVVKPNDDEPQDKPAATLNLGNLQKLSVKPQDGKFGLLYNFDDKSVVGRIQFEDNIIKYLGENSKVCDSKAISFMPQGYCYEYSVTINRQQSTADFSIGYRFTPSINCGVVTKGNSIQLFKHGTFEWEESAITIPEQATSYTLKMKCIHGSVSFWVQFDNKPFKKIPHAYDISDWNPNIIRGFSYVNPCLWAVGNGTVYISNIIYQNLEEY